MNRKTLIDEIKRLKTERKAVIVAHSYQNEDIQAIADVTGDSYALSKYCADMKEAEVIVFCGVHFMAESAKILSPLKTVLLPEIKAGCPMADMVDRQGLIAKKKEHPNATVLCYINSTAEVKAECDVCCTSSNAVDIVKKIETEEILFVPDKNLSRYVAAQVPEKKIVLWEGFCPVHNSINPEIVREMKDKHPEAKLLIHPECTPEICEFADYIGSTKQIIDYAKESPYKEFIIGTEMGVMSILERENPDKMFHLLDSCLVCKDMKITTLESVYNALKNNTHEIVLDREVMDKARGSLERMLELG